MQWWQDMSWMWPSSDSSSSLRPQRWWFCARRSFSSRTALKAQIVVYWCHRWIMWTDTDNQHQWKQQASTQSINDLSSLNHLIWYPSLVFHTPHTVLLLKDSTWNQLSIFGLLYFTHLPYYTGYLKNKSLCNLASNCSYFFLWSDFAVALTLCVLLRNLNQ